MRGIASAILSVLDLGLTRYSHWLVPCVVEKSVLELYVPAMMLLYENVSAISKTLHVFIGFLIYNSFLESIKNRAVLIGGCNHTW